MTCGWDPRPGGRSTGTASTTTGTGTGTTATATPATRAPTSSTSRAGGSRRTSTRSRSRRAAASSRPAAASQETPNVHTTLFTYADGKVLEFATRGIHTNEEGTQKIGNLFYGSKGWLWIDGDGRGWQSYLGRKDEKGPGRDGGRAGRAATPRCCPHRASAPPELRGRHPGRRPHQADAEIEEGHLSVVAAPPGQHRVPGGEDAHVRPAAEKFKDDKEADALLTRPYRKGFELPAISGGAGTSNNNE